MRYSAYDDYQSTKHEWMSIPSTWSIMNLSHAVRMKSGENITSLEISPQGEYPVYGGNGIRGFYDAYTHSGEFILIGRQGALCGNIKLVEGEFWASEHAVVITADRELIVSWLSYLLASMNLNQYSVSAAQPGLSVEAIGSLKIPFPSIHEQQKIAAFLDYKTQQIDQLIEKKKALIEKLNEQRIAVITQAVTKGLDKAAKMKPSGVDWLGDVPEHWGSRKLKFLTDCALQYGANEAAVLDDRDLPRFIRITDVKDDGSLHDDTFRSLPEDIAEPFLLEEGDILLARSGATVGKSFKYSKSWGKAAFAGYLIKFSVNKEIMDEDYAYLYFQSSVFWANINSTLIQSTIQNFSAEKYANIVQPLPDLEEQKKIVSYLSASISKIDKMKNKAQCVIEKLEEYRSSLITAAVTGKIDVRNFEIIKGVE